MKVALVSAAWPPVRCGVGDYTSMLAAALEAAGQEVLRFGAQPRRWDTRAARMAARDLAHAAPDIVHVQYPSTGYGRSLLPTLLPALLPRRCVVTLHEYSIFRPYRWPWFAGFAYAAEACVFTSTAERDRFRARMPCMRARSTVIPIGSNIPRGRPAEKLARSVCYFGLLMPGKGIEEFLDLAEQLNGAADGWRGFLIGAAAPGCGAYADTILARAAALGVATHIGLPPGEVGDILQTMMYAYLPGPGGITGRRGSVLAALENDVQVIGPLGECAPAWLSARVWNAATPAAAWAALTRGPGAGTGAILPETPPAHAETSWHAIAARHVELYRGILQPRGAA
jgi:glycosyltransferase involved in cell wall biosynthesis